MGLNRDKECNRVLPRHKQHLAALLRHIPALRAKWPREQVPRKPGTLHIIGFFPKADNPRVHREVDYKLLLGKEEPQGARESDHAAGSLGVFKQRGFNDHVRGALPHWSSALPNVTAIRRGK